MPTIRVLQVEDSRLDAELVLTELEADHLACEVRLVDDEPGFLAALDDFRPDIVLSDLSIPGFSGQHALELLRQRDEDLPFIFVSATLGEEAAIEALRNGATDYILKQNPARLASAVRRALSEASARRASRRAEAELIRAQRFESLAMLAGGLSHDLRNLLQPLLLAGDSLQDYQNDPRLARLGKLVRDCGKRGLDMVHSMLSFASGARRAEQVRLGALFSAFDLLMQGSVPHTMTMELAIDDPELSFEGNHTELQQCLLNLCLNAIQAMPEDGHLRVETAQTALPADFFRAREPAQPGRYLRISVIDDGPGMDQSVLDHLFEPFFTTKENGTGLGLLSCKRIVGSHGGVMRVDSQPGRGTRFDLYFPLEQRAVERDQDDRSYLEGAAERVLVVVEEAGQLSLLTDTLDAWGYQAHASQSGTAALQWIEAAGLPDLVVLDADMNLFTGARTLAALIEQGYGSAVILLARPGATPDLHELPPLEHLYVVDKPVTTQVLLRTLRKARQADGRGS
ncbi:MULTISPECIES: response regulator [Rhodanobacter]|uniref:response regulator n=1 Tax=Rhodanobacter TaxID=75309 RepID=UPI000489FACF|nr:MULTISPECIES: response regulator [Rhodanobacter]KZC21458.1 histidine kinase [Rhodanobacter denitrificans]UJJ51758.1 response regulator [Rhodanobacter denitrificans]UJM94502.1 response regulator [Rhodanobacter denitrificans]UJM98032.1 response regulator [Rhodanobacter denitrificans]UJN22554.1 response regulator [Rhodanobacter denitrificans]